MVVGAGIGLAVDYVLAKGLELAGRTELEKDVAFALRTAQGEWRYVMETELRRSVGAILDDAVQLTAAAYQPEVKKHPSRDERANDVTARAPQLEAVPQSIAGNVGSSAQQVTAAR